MHIFGDITNSEGEVKIKDFVLKLLRLDKSLVEEDLFRCCRTLDADGSGTISIDEFLEYFGEINNSSDEVLHESDLEDEMWPDWCIKEGQLGHIQGLLLKMYGVLEKEYGISAEEAFRIYDESDTGVCTL
jgi:hypothetical protein